MLCIFVLGLAFGNGIFPLVTGITLYSNETHVQASGFTLVCDVGGTISTSVSVDDPSGSTVGACLAPPGVCGSNDGNDVVRDVTGGTVSVTIKSANIHTTNYVGSWTCTDGINSATFTINEIVTYTRITISPKTATFGDKVTIKMDCVYPYPNIRIDYVKEFDTDSVLSSESEVKFTNGTALNCPVVDSRAISVSGTFTLKDTNLKESAKIKATAMFGTSSATYTISEFTLISGSTTTESAINLSTDVGTSANSDTSKNSTESSSTTLSSVSFSDKSTLEGNTLSFSTESVNTKSETSTAPVTASPSGLSEEMIIIIIIVSSSVGGILLIVVIITVVLCKRKSGTEKRENRKKKHGMFHIKNGNNKDLNSNYDQVQNNEYSTKSRRNFQGDTNLYKKNPQYIFYGDRIPTGVEYPRSKNYHQQKCFPRNQHHYRNQNIEYYLPYTDPRNVMYYQRYPGSEYSEDMSGYSRAGPYRMQQVYPKSYPRQDRYTDEGLERRIGHRRGQYEDNWDDTLY